MSTFAELKDLADTPANIRKALQGIAFLAPMSAVVPTSLLATTGGGLKPLPPAEKWQPIGIVGKDGYELARDISKDEVEAFGYSDPVRVDITKAAKSLKVTPLESDKRVLLEAAYGLDLSAVAAANNEVVFEEPDLPEGKEYRLLAIFMDGTVAKPYYRGFCLTKAKVADVGAEKFGDEARQQELTFDALTGPEGFSVRHYIGGAGFDPVAQGFKTA